MKKLTGLVLLLCIIISVIFSGTVLAKQEIDTPQDNVEEQYLIPFLEALQHQDMEAMHKLWIDQYNTEKGDKNIEMLFDTWRGRGFSSIKRLKVELQAANGPAPSAKNYTYEVMNGNEKIIVNLSIADDSKRIQGFEFQSQPTGTLSTWKQFNVVQWFITALAAAEVILSLYAAKQCIKNRPRLWGIWLIFILVPYGGVVISNLNDLIVTFYIATFSLPKILIYKYVGIQAYLSVPIGTITYLIKFKYKKKRDK